MRKTAVSTIQIASAPQMVRQPDDVLRIAAPYFANQIGRKIVQLFLEEPAVSVRRMHIPAANHVPQPEHQEQIPVHAAPPGVAQVAVLVLRGQLALRPERAFRGEL